MKVGSTWFDAKQYCSEQNQTLASFSGADLSPFKALIAGKVRGWADAWIGLRLTDYYFLANNGRFLCEMLSMDLVFYTLSNILGNCVVLTYC